MDFNLKHWRNQQYESENQHQHSAKIPKLLSNNLLHEANPQYQKPELPSSGSALPLFVPQLQPNNKISSHLSSSSHPFPDHSTPTPTPSTTSRLPKMGSGYFSMAQWQELELQALIFRYMLAGAAVPAELLQPIKKSISGLLTTPHYFQHQHQQHYPHPLHQYYPHCHPASAALIQTGYWGRAAMDPEPGRCRRTDGKKWRCSRDVVVGQKYCERHMHRGRNRSRKPVEIPTHAAGKVSGAAAGAGGGGGGGGGGVVSSGNPITGGGTHFALAGPTSSASAASIDLMRLSRSSSDVKRENKHIFKSNDGEKSDGHVLRHFFDDWPRSVQEPDNVGITNNSTTGSMNSSTSLSISMPGNLSSDVSLKLSTGNGEVPGHAETRAHSNRQSGWTAGWNSSPMGGPLAEALRSSNSNSSPTSVLHQLPRGSASETCVVST